MSFKVLARTTRNMKGYYEIGPFDTREQRDEFIKDPQIWWYLYPEDLEDLFFGGNDAHVSWTSPRSSAGGWKKGGAWGSQPEERNDARTTGMQAPAEPEEGERW